MAEDPPPEGVVAAYEAFVAGERPDDVAVFAADSVVDDDDAFVDRAMPLGDGHLLVVSGDRGRAVFDRAASEPVMAFAREAGRTEGRVDRDLAGADCPDADGGDHAVAVLFAFCEPRNPEVGGRYAEGDVLHAYVECVCGRRYSDRWVIGA